MNVIPPNCDLDSSTCKGIRFGRYAMACGDRATGNICAAKVRIVRWRRRGGGEIACADDELSWIVGRLDKGFRNRAGAELGAGF